MGYVTAPGQSYEVFEVADGLNEESGLEHGFYWQACFPGCLPDGDPVGPYSSEADAQDDITEEIAEQNDLAQYWAELDETNASNSAAVLG